MADSPFNDAVEALEEVDRQVALLLLRPEDLNGLTFSHVENISCFISHALEKLKPAGGTFASGEGEKKNARR